MNLHEIAIGSVYISPILLYAFFTLPLTYGVLRMVHRFKLSRFTHNEILFIITLYIILFAIMTLISPL